MQSLRCPGKAWAAGALTESPRARLLVRAFRRGVIVPPLPEKNAVQKFTMGTDFIEDRRRALQVCGLG